MSDAPMAPPDIADGVERRLDPRYVPFQRAVGWIVTASISAGLLLSALIVWLAGDLPRWMSLMLGPVWLALTGGIGWFCYAWPVLVQRHTLYTVDTHGIEIRSGVWWRAVTWVPRSRVQHIDVSQGPMERTHDLGRLIIHTAGTDHARVELPGLNHAVAFRIRNHLLPQGSDDAV